MYRQKQDSREVLHFPTLKTVMAIEDVIRNADVAVSRNQTISRLEKKVMRSTLIVSLEYLEKKGIILETKNGFIWTFNPNNKLSKAEEDALEV